jgi:tetratricopeptide (TPR) repeat protein
VPAESKPAASGFRVLPGSTIGEFEMVRILGRGGMGEVWEARQRSLGRRVALKLLLPERVDSKGLEFFAREARAGARLTHPGIVAVHGSGEDEGLHWIAMEFVPEACDLRHALDAFREEPELPPDYYPHVARLVVQVADAMQAAHDAGVIHRDLKPANLLVGEDDRPRVTDFGLARVADEAALSMTGEVAGTYYYMSPEQVAGRRMGLDHRTDIFSLGVILYELLTLCRPFEGDTTEQIAHKILVTEPPPPTELRSRIPRDLAVICGKAMEKDPAQRYGSMAELATDLRRFLEGEPIVARPPGPGERARRWARRHRAQALVLTGGAAALVVISALGLAAFRQSELARVRAVELEAQALALETSNHDLERQRQQAEAERTRAESSELETREALARSEAVGAMLRDMIATNPGALGARIDEACSDLLAARLEGLPAAEREARVEHLRADLALAGATDAGKRVLVEGLLRPMAERLDAAPPEDPEVEVQLRFALSDVYHHPLALFDEALEQRGRGLILLEEELGPEHPATLVGRGKTATILFHAGRYEEAGEALEALLEPAARVLGPDSPTTEGLRTNLAITLQYLGRTGESIAIQREALGLREGRLGAGHHDCLVLRNNLATALARHGDLEGAEEVLREELEVGAEVLAVNTSLRAWTLSLLGGVLHARRELEEAEAVLVESIELQSEALGRSSPFTAEAIRTLSRVLEDQGRYAEAEPLIRECLQLREQEAGVGSGAALAERHRLYRCLRAEGRHAEAGELARDARPEADADRGTWLQLAARGLAAGGRHELAIDLQRDAIFLLREAHGDEDTRTQVARLVLAEGLAAADQPAEARRILDELVARFAPEGANPEAEALERAVAARDRLRSDG